MVLELCLQRALLQSVLTRVMRDTSLLCVQGSLLYVDASLLCGIRSLLCDNRSLLWFLRFLNCASNVPSRKEPYFVFRFMSLLCVNGSLLYVNTPMNTSLLCINRSLLNVVRVSLLCVNRSLLCVDRSLL